MMQDRNEPAMRGLFRTDAHGQFWFTSILPESYPIPNDGPVGELLRAANRPHMRPAHVHVRIEAPGYERLTSMLFIEGDKFLDADPVFGVKNSLVVPFQQKTGIAHAGRRRCAEPVLCGRL